MSHLLPISFVPSELVPPKAGASLGATVAVAASPTLALVTSTASDAELVAHMRDGHARAEEYLFKRHARMVFRVARRSLRDATEAEDIVQETFARAHEQIGKLRDPAAYRGWLAHIAMRLVQRRFRTRRLLAALGFVPMPEGPGLAELAREGLTADERVDLVRIDQALAQIDRGDRLAWFLRHVEGLTLPEVAIACDCSLATAKRRLARAQDHVAAVTRSGGDHA